MYAGFLSESPTSGGKTSPPIQVFYLRQHHSLTYCPDQNKVEQLYELLNRDAVTILAGKAQRWTKFSREFRTDALHQWEKFYELNYVALHEAESSNARNTFFSAIIGGTVALVATLYSAYTRPGVGMNFAANVGLPLVIGGAMFLIAGVMGEKYSTSKKALQNASDPLSGAAIRRYLASNIDLSEGLSALGTIVKYKSE